MPVYVCECEKCGKTEEVYRTIAQMDDLPSCHGKKMHRTISAHRIIADIQPYRSMVTGEMITSRSQHRAHLKQHRLTEIGNEINAHMKEAGKPKRRGIDRERRRKEIAAIVNSKL